MPPISGSGSSAVQLPNDVWATIISYLDKRSLRKIRFCCTWLAREAARYLFHEVCFEMREKDLERVIGIATSSMTAHAVKVLRLAPTPRLPKLNFKDLCMRNELAPEADPGTDDFKSGSNSSDSEEEDEESSSQGEVLSSRQYQDELLKRLHKELKFLHFKKQVFRQLLQECEAQQNEPSFYDCLHVLDPNSPKSVRVAPQDREMSTSQLETTTGKLRRFQKTCARFEDALQKFHNLQELWVDYSRSDRPNEIFWCGYTIGVGHDSFYGLEKKRAISKETAPLAFVLRALGKRNASSTSLTSLRLLLTGDDWWGPQDLKYAWVPPQEEDDKENRSRLSQIVSANNLTLMDDAFTYLTDVRVRFEEREEMPEFMAALARLLRKSSGLTRLELELQIVDEDDLQWKHLDLLTEINNCTGSSTLTDLCLTKLQFSEASILHLLSLTASSLKSLTLRSCLLLGEDSAWPHFYEKMRLIPFHVLNDLDFRECWQTLEHKELPDTPIQEWSSKDLSSRSVVFHCMESDPESCVGYSSAIYDYILGRTNFMPPLQRFYDYPRDSALLFDWFDRVYGGSRWPYWY